MIRRAPAWLALASLAGCSLAPPYQRPALPVPPSWPTGAAYMVTAADAALPSVPYREIFRDPRLQAIMAQALANNRDLRIAAANIAAARAKYRIQRAELLPEVDSTGSYQHSYGGGGTAQAGGVAPRAASGNNFATDIGVTAFEVDLFGRVRSLTAAARDRYFEQRAVADATRLTLVGDIAAAWLTYASDRSLLSIDQQTSTSARQSVSLTKDRFAQGIAAHSDVDQAEQILHIADADAAQQVTQIAQDANALQLLVGAPVDPALLPPSIENAAPTIAAPPAGLDSTILLRRPDVIEAEDELRATSAEIGVARAQLFPTISLTGIAGFASSALASLFTGGAFNWSAGASVSYPIFRAGAARAQVRYSRAQRDAALATYEKAIQTAFQEVSDALARRGTIDAQVAAVTASVVSAQDYLAMSDMRYRGGVETYLQMLDAQRTLYSARRTLAYMQLVKAANRVTLYCTLGGDASLGGAAVSPQRSPGLTDGPRAAPN